MERYPALGFRARSPSSAGRGALNPLQQQRMPQLPLYVVQPLAKEDYSGPVFVPRYFFGCVVSCALRFSGDFASTRLIIPDLGCNLCVCLRRLDRTTLFEGLRPLCARVCGSSFAEGRRGVARATGRLLWQLGFRLLLFLFKPGGVWCGSS